VLLRGGTRDLLRRRLHLVRKRGPLLAHLQNLTPAYERGAFAQRIAYPSNREEPRYVLGAATLRRNRSEDRPRGETITE